MPTTDDARRTMRARLLAADSLSESDDASVVSSCGGGAGCSGCEPHLAIRVVRIGDGDDDDDDDGFDGFDEDNKNSDTEDSAVFPKPLSAANRPVRARAVGRAVLHAGGGFSFKQDKPRRASSPTNNENYSMSNNPFARCFSWIWSFGVGVGVGGGGGGSGGGDASSSSSSSSSPSSPCSYEVMPDDLVGAVEVFKQRGEGTERDTERQQQQQQQQEQQEQRGGRRRRGRVSNPAAPFAFAPYSASRGRMPPLRPIPSCPPPPPPPSSSSSSLPLPPTTPSTSSIVVDVIRRAAAPWDNQLPSDPPRPRSALVVVNPTAGGGRGAGLFESLLSPMLEAAGVSLEGVVVTSKPGDARRAALAADPSRVGALVAVGGDGTAAELLQGLMSRGEEGEEEEDASAGTRRMPLAILPAGSGNALALGVLRPNDPSTPSPPPSSSSSSVSSSPAVVCAVRAAAAIARGRSAPLDVVVADSRWDDDEDEEEEEGVEEEEAGGATTSAKGNSNDGRKGKNCPRPRFAKNGALLLSRPSLSPRPPSSSSASSSPPPQVIIARRFGFLSLTYGLIANADVGTDGWRWMGPARFTLGALREVLARRSHALEAFVVDAAAAGGTPFPFPSSSSSSSAGEGSSSSSSPRLATPFLDSLPAAALEASLPRQPSAARNSPPPSPPWRRLAADDAALFAACNLSHLDASTHLAPGARRDCGSMHVVRTRGAVPRLAALRLLASAESGRHIESSSSSSCSPTAAAGDKSGARTSAKTKVSVDRVRALLLRPLDASEHGRLALDGEELPRGKPVACEVVPGGARLIVREF